MERLTKELHDAILRTWLPRIFWTLALIAVLVFIFSNSLASGEVSSEQSYAVTEQVQEVARVVAPDSKIATATGDDFVQLHINVRTAAHFCQFALLGAVAFWCYRSYTRKKLFALFPIVGTAATAFMDECLQLSSEGRAWEWVDIAVDVSGGMLGIVFALLVCIVCRTLIKKRKENG